MSPEEWMASQRKMSPEEWMASQKTPSFSEKLKTEALNSFPVQAGLGAIRGAGSIGATLLAPRDALESFIVRKMGAPELAPQDRRAAMQAGIEQMGADPKSLGFQGGKIGAEIAGTMGVGGVLANAARGMKAAPSVVEALRTGGMSVGGATGAGAQAARVIGGAGTSGASAFAVNPEDALTGAAIGAVIPGGVQVAGALGRGVGKVFRPSAENMQAAQLAQKYGINVGLGDITQNSALQATRSILRDAPVSGGMAAAAQATKQGAFNKAIGGTFGASEEKLTLSVLDNAKQRLGGEFDRIWNNNALQVDPNMINKMQSVRAQAMKLPSNEGGAVIREIDDLYSKMATDANGAAIIPGDVANKFQSYLRRRGESFPALSEEFGQLRSSILDAFNASVSPADAASLTLNRTQYKAFKTVEPLLRGAELGVAGRAAGDVPAALLSQAVNKSYGNLLNVPLADLSQVGSKFLVDRTPRTGGSARAALQNTAIGATLMGTGGWPALMAGVPIAAGMQKIMQSPAAAKALMGQGKITLEMLQMLRAAQLSAPVISAQ